VFLRIESEDIEVQWIGDRVSAIPIRYDELGRGVLRPCFALAFDIGLDILYIFIIGIDVDGTCSKHRMNRNAIGLLGFHINLRLAIHFLEIDDIVTGTSV
jgi:hypothetical protein